MTVVIPASVQAQGMVKVIFAPAIAAPTAATVAELTTATGAVDISCFLMPDWGGITADQAKGSDTRFCSTESFERLGRVTRSIADLTYTYLPQALGTDAANKVFTALAPGTNGFLIVRLGVAVSADVAAAQKYIGLPVTTGVQTYNVTGSDEFAPLTVTQGLGATGVLFTGTVAA